MRCLVHRETGWQVWWPVSIKETESKGGSLENNPFFDWKPVKHLRSDLACSWLTLLWGKIHLWLPSFEFSEACTVQLLTVYVNEQRVAVVQLTDNKRIRDIYEIYTKELTHERSSVFPCEEMADRGNSSHLKICFTTRYALPQTD